MITKRNMQVFLIVAALLILLAGTVSAAPDVPAVNSWDASTDFIVDTPTVTFVTEEIKEFILELEEGLPANSVLLTKPNDWGGQGSPFEVGTELRDNVRQWVCYPAELCGGFVGHIYQPFEVGAVIVDETTVQHAVVTYVDDDEDGRRVSAEIWNDQGDVLESHLLPQGMAVNAHIVEFTNSGRLVIIPGDSIGMVVAMVTELIPQLPDPEWSLDVDCQAMSATVASGQLNISTYLDGNLFIDFVIRADAGMATGSAWSFVDPIQGSHVITATGALFDVLGQQVEEITWSQGLDCPVPAPEPELTHSFSCPTEIANGSFTASGHLRGMDLGDSGAVFRMDYRADDSQQWGEVHRASYPTNEPIQHNHTFSDYGQYHWFVEAGQFSADAVAICTAPTAIIGDDGAPAGEPSPPVRIYFPLMRDD